MTENLVLRQGKIDYMRRSPPCPNTAQRLHFSPPVPSVQQPAMLSAPAGFESQLCWESITQSTGLRRVLFPAHLAVCRLDATQSITSADCPAPLFPRSLLLPVSHHGAAHPAHESFVIGHSSYRWGRMGSFTISHPQVLAYHPRPSANIVVSMKYRTGWAFQPI